MVLPCCCSKLALQWSSFAGSSTKCLTAGQGFPVILLPCPVLVGLDFAVLLGTSSCQLDAVHHDTLKQQQVQFVEPGTAVQRTQHSITSHQRRAAVINGREHGKLRCAASVRVRCAVCQRHCHSLGQSGQQRCIVRSSCTYLMFLTTFAGLDGQMVMCAVCESL